jgi:serine/threonine-protein kinase ATR
MRACITETYAEAGMLPERGYTSAVQGRYDVAKAAAAGGRPGALADWLSGELAAMPPRFHRWFLGKFAEPGAWHAARLAYARSMAAWSAVGHAVGLGDRHGENILMDEVRGPRGRLGGGWRKRGSPGVIVAQMCSVSEVLPRPRSPATLLSPTTRHRAQASGEAVFIDFSCLFDRGLTLAAPEVVPFRLTQNVIDGFGVAGHEGAFRRAFEATLGVLRAHAETVLSVLEPFVHDPLVEWRKDARGGGAEGVAAVAADIMATTEGRLKGTLLGALSAPCSPLGVEGHAHRLIAEATALENLSRMYIWWQAWW